MATVRKDTPERRELIAQALARGCSRRQAALAAGINPSQFYRWLKRKPDFRTTVEAAERERCTVLKNHRETDR